jgi:NADH-quinone oxidoreductase subunit F
MHFEQIYNRAKSECDYLLDRLCIKICVSSSADNSTAAGVFKSFQKESEKSGIRAKVIATGSLGYYDLEPVVLIKKPGEPDVMILYHNVTPEMASELFNDCLINDNPRPDMAFCTTGREKVSGIPHVSEMPLLNLQNRIALRNCGYTDPENVDHYIMHGKGYSGLSRALQMKPTDVIRELKKSGLRGRGGAGYFTADKWQICHDAEGDEKYAVCNAIDADPRARTARLLMESDPHSVLEGFLIGAYAVGASHGFICVNREHAQAVKTLRKALEQMRQYNLLGKDILDSNFSTEIEVKELSASLVAGEETALLCALEERQAIPYLRTNYPATGGYKNRPALVNNIETLSGVSAIFQNNPEWGSDLGTEKSRGTKVITLSGRIARKYTVEVPFGTTLRTLVQDIGGGVADGKDIKAVQFGGPTGAYFSGSSLDILVSYEAMEGADSIIGSGTVEVFGDDTCAVELARDAISYIQTQSCGKCVFCREGSLQMSQILADIADNRGSPRDLDLLTELGEGMKTGSICGLGQTAPAPVLSSIQLFRSDYDTHMKEKRCPAGK